MRIAVLVGELDDACRRVAALDPKVAARSVIAPAVVDPLASTAASLVPVAVIVTVCVMAALLLSVTVTTA